MMQIEVIDKFDKFLKFESVWNDLLAQSDMDIPFMTFEWFSCWWKCYGDKNEMFIILVKQGGEIIAIAPLMKKMIKFRGLPVRAITLICNDHSNRVGFVIIKKGNEAVRHLLQYIINSNAKFDMIFFDYIPEECLTDKFLLEALQEDNFKFKRKQSILSPYISIDRNWDDYLMTRSRTFRKSMRHVRNIVGRYGRYEIILYVKDNVSEGMKDLMSVSEKTWKYKKNTAIASNSNDLNFYRLLAEAMSSKGYLNIWILKINGRPIAFEFSLRYKKNIYSLKTGFDEKYYRLSPSVLLDTFVIKNSFDNNANEYDLLGDKDRYKLRWTSLVRKHCYCYFFGNSGYGKILAFLEYKVITNIKKQKLMRYRRGELR
ncbi:MAG: GNAT family N-acetyltransferase [Candidatus Omnitrophota bacterium]